MKQATIQNKFPIQPKSAQSLEVFEVDKLTSFKNVKFEKHWTYDKKTTPSVKQAGGPRSTEINGLGSPSYGQSTGKMFPSYGVNRDGAQHGVKQHELPHTFEDMSEELSRVFELVNKAYAQADTQKIPDYFRFLRALADVRRGESRLTGSYR